MPIPYDAGEALTCGQIRELDVLAIEHVGIPGVVLMENAGRGIAEFVYDRLVDPAAARVLVLCGGGNNGGDGFVVARHLHNAGVAVTVALAVPPEKLRGDADINFRILERMGLGLVRAFEAADQAERRPEASRPGAPDSGNALDQVRAAADAADIIVDALLGTGSQGAPHGVMAELIRIANAATRGRRIAVDIPSGLDADSGAVNEPCFRADATVTMLAPKIGFEVPAARAVVGRVVVVDIGTPRRLIPGRKDLPRGA
jgi:NAD(P)H-hydrate epimerase